MIRNALLYIKIRLTKLHSNNKKKNNNLNQFFFCEMLDNSLFCLFRYSTDKIVGHVIRKERTFVIFFSRFFIVYIVI